MPVDDVSPSGGGDPSQAVRYLLRTAVSGSLATLDRENGHPYASLVLVATEPDGTPIFLISRLALHTLNLEKDPRASLLLDGTAGLADPLTGGRATLIGTARPHRSDTALRRFVQRHPAARAYASFPDFAIYALAVSSAHYIGGFGRIVDLAGATLVTDVTGAEALIAAEPDIVDHMNVDHADALELYATVFGRCPPGAWRMTGIDPEGADLVHCNKATRVAFPAPVRTPHEARNALVALAREARAQRAGP